MNNSLPPSRSDERQNLETPPKSMRDRDRKAQILTQRQMVWNQAYPFIAALCTLGIIVIASVLLPISRQSERWNACFEKNLRLSRIYHTTDSMLVSRLWATRYCNGGSVSLPRH